MCTYLFKRGSVYCFRRSIPEHLRAIIGRQEFSRSLRTKDRGEAKQLIPQHVIASDKELAAAQAVMDKMSGPVPSVADYHTVAAWRRREEAEWEHQQATEKFYEEKDAAQAARQEARASHARRLRERLRLTTAELVFLTEHHVAPQINLLGDRNRQNLTETIYTQETIFDNILEAQMEHAAVRDEVVSALLRLLKKKRILLL